MEYLCNESSEDGASMEGVILMTYQSFKEALILMTKLKEEWKAKVVKSLIVGSRLRSTKFRTTFFFSTISCYRELASSKIGHLRLHFS